MLWAQYRNSKTILCILFQRIHHVIKLTISDPFVQVKKCDEYWNIPWNIEYASTMKLNLIIHCIRQKKSQLHSVHVRKERPKKEAIFGFPFSLSLLAGSFGGNLFLVFPDRCFGVVFSGYDAAYLVHLIFHDYHKRLDSSVGRASDWRSEGPVFDSQSRQHFYYYYNKIHFIPH